MPPMPPMCPPDNETFKDPRTPHRTETERASALFVLFEGERLSAGGARHAMGRLDEVVLGRGDARTAHRRVADGVRLLEVRLPDRRMSGVHLRLTRTADRWMAVDAGSTNGSRLNGRPLGKALLADGDVLELGWSVLRFREALPTPLDAPLDLDAPACDPQTRGLTTLLPEGARALADLERVARSDVPIVLLGETGTGKEIVARAIHRLSGRAGRGKTMVAINCGALPDALVESQLFGHVKGAFSGAVRDEPGLVRASDGGTLFLDELGDLPLRAQAALLRVLQEREVTPVGGVRAIPVDLRVVAATNRPLDAMVARGEFRSDLYARLSGFVHALLPLRERLEDIGLLAADLLASRADGARLSLSPDAARAFLRHRWPLNVRELAQCLSLASVLARDGIIDAKHLPATIARDTDPGEDPAARDAIDPRFEEDERLRASLVQELGKHGGNVTEVARALGKARTQVHRWIKRFNLDVATFRRG
jgi:transcriptional regulator with AAA-type ATPase domain